MTQQAALLATNRFPTYFAAQTARGSIVVLATWIGCTVGGTAVSIAIAVGSSSVILAPLLTAHILHKYGIGWQRFVLVFLQGPLAAVFAAAAAQGIAWVILPSQVQFLPEGEEPTRLWAVVEFVVLGMAYVLVYILVARVVLYDGLVDLSSAMPRPIARLMRQVLRLPKPVKSTASENESNDTDPTDTVDSAGAP